MNPTLAPVPRSGVAGLHVLAPPAITGSMPIAQTQAALALVAPEPSLTSRPTLRLVSTAEPSLDAFAARFAQAVVEVIAGDRGVHQLMRWTTEEVYADLMHRSHVLQRTTPADRRLRRLRAQVRSVHLFRPDDDVAELSIHVRHGQRSRAIAARIELIERRWRCTVLEFG